MMNEYFTSLESGIEQALRNGQGSPRKLYTLGLARLGKRLYSENGTIAWCGITAPFDLLSAMGVTSCFVEFIGAMLASTGFVGEFIEAADHAGYSSDACSYHRSVHGAAAKGIMPSPSFLVATTNPCSGGLAVLEGLARNFGKRIFTLHIPQDESTESVAFLAGQIRELADFAGEVTGKKLDRDLLSSVIEKSNRATEIVREIYDLAATVPSPLTSRDLGNFGIVMALFLGTDTSIEIAAAWRDELRRRIADRAGGKNAEKHRLLWIQNRIQFRHGLDEILERDYGAVIVADELNDVTWDPIDPAEPFDGLARRSISIPFNGPVGRRVDHLKKLAQKYRIDGAVNPCNWGCRQGTGARGLIEEGLKEAGIPVLNLEVDCVDQRKFTEGQFRTRLEAFMEMLSARQ